MKISQKTFKELLTSDQIPFWTATAIIGRAYCGPMTVKGMCSTDCTLCQSKLQGALELSAAKNPQALLTWKLRDLIAQNQEERQAEEHKFSSPSSFQEEVNPFEAILNEIKTA